MKKYSELEIYNQALYIFLGIFYAIFEFVLIKLVRFR